MVDLGGRRSAAGHDISRGAARAVLGGGRARRLLRATGDVEDVELAACGGLDGVLDGGVVRHVVAVHDVLFTLIICAYERWKGRAYVVPVALSQLQHGGLEAELADPRARLGVIARQGNLARVVVPRAQQMDRLDIGRSAQRKLQLNGSHCAG